MVRGTAWPHDDADGGPEDEVLAIERLAVEEVVERGHRVAHVEAVEVRREAPLRLLTPRHGEALLAKAGVEVRVRVRQHRDRRVERRPAVCAAAARGREEAV